MIAVNDIRRRFLDYFRGQDHAVVASGPLVPDNDPTLMFTNSGMVPFKNLFTGAETRSYQRAVTAQKCVRAGGKHNDLENVGVTARHHTFFEMLGNFSFGDYFKERAIELAWTLTTREFGLPVDRLLVTVYAEDDQAFDLWRRIAGLPEHRILRIATNDNFWSMGETGPCGPCSELFYDHGPGIPGGPPGSPDQDGDRYIEFWNLVFMQFEQQAGGARVALPRPSIDTGMGLERIASILNGTHDNYRLDLLRRIIEAAADLTSTDPDGPQRVSHRVIADHLRASAFLIADGVLPANEGRGYVLRRIMRRAMRHAHLLGAQEPLMHRLVPVLVGMMGGHYTELVRAEALIRETLRLEETRFRSTLDRGLRLLGDATQRLGEREPLPGDVAFRLYDTYGFPLDLTQDVLRAQNRAVDLAGFEAAMAAQRAEARRAWAGSGATATEAVWFELADRVGPSEFLGYDRDTAQATVLALLRDGQPVDTLHAGEAGVVVVNQTPFYAESGGQVGDQGMIFGTVAGPKGDTRFMVHDTRRPHGGLISHMGTMDSGQLAVGQAVRLTIDTARRARVRANHSATHLLHEALRRTLGDHVAQKGSLVAPDRLRFDFSQPRAIEAAELDEIEAEVNAQIRANAPVVTRLMALDAAIDSGARALFGEKYDNEVRVVSMGSDGPRPEAGSADPVPRWSVELCGGTHVARTGEIGLLRIVAEQAVAAGVRRVEAVTGQGALDLMRQQQATLSQLSQIVRAPEAELADRVAQLAEDRRRLEREVSELRLRLATGGGGAGAPAPAEQIGDLAVIARVVQDVPAKDLKPMVDAFKQQLGSGVAIVISVAEGKGSVVAGTTADLSSRIDSVTLVRLAAEAMGGKGGGGRADMAQAGGPDGARADAALDAVRAHLRALA